MNMHGIITPAAEAPYQRGTADRVVGWVKAKRLFLLVVVLPTLLVAAYYFLVAADQYESEAHFVVRSATPTPSVGSGLGQVLSFAGATGGSETEAMSVADYLTSHDVVDTMRKRVDLVGRFRRPEADILSRLRDDDPTPEALLKYYRKQVSVYFSRDTGITTLTVKAFRPGDAFDINRALLQLGEQRVNMLNDRSYADAISTSRRQLEEAENAVAVSQSRLTRFRQTKGDIDPKGSGQAQIGLVSGLTQSLSAARAQLSAMAGLISTSSPQYIALATRVRALEAQVASQSGRLAGGSGAIAADLGGFEDLQLRKEFAAKRYEAAAAAFQKARDDALRQQLYVVRVVDANMPVKSTYPERWRVIATVFFSLLLAYAIGWLIAAGVREHAA